MHGTLSILNTKIKQKYLSLNETIYYVAIYVFQHYILVYYILFYGHFRLLLLTIEL